MADPLVADLMTTPVLTVAPDDRASDVVGAMAQEAIKSVVVITDECAVEGIFTATDYMHVAVDESAASATVEDCMTTGVVTVAPTDTVATAATRMADNDISHLPVVDDDDQVTGILTSTDLVPCLADGRSG